MITKLLLLVLTVIGSLVGLAIGKVKLGLVGAVPLAVWILWRDGQLLVAALVFPTINVGLGGSVWATPYKLMLGLALAKIALNIQSRIPLRAPPSGITFAYVALVLSALLVELTSGSEPHVTILNDGASTLLMLWLMSQFIQGPTVLTSLLILVNAATFMQLAAVAVEMWQHGNDLRCVGLSGQPNVLGFSIGRMVPISLSAALVCQNRRLRFVSAVAVAGGLYVIMASGSRGGMVAAIAGLLVVLALTSRSLPLLALRIATGGILMVAVIPIAPRMYKERILDTVAESPDSHGDRTSGRLTQANEIVDLVQRQPLFGVGMGGYLDHAARTRLGQRTMPHSSFMGIAVAWGLIIAAFWLAVQLSGVWAALVLRGRLGKQGWQADGLAGALCGSIVGSLSSPQYFTASLWGVVLLAHVLVQRTPRAARSQSAVANPSAPQVAGIGREIWSESSGLPPTRPS